MEDDTIKAYSYTYSINANIVLKMSDQGRASLLRDSIPPISPSDERRSFNHGGYGGRVPYSNKKVSKVSIQTSEKVTRPSTSEDYASMNTPGRDRDPITPLGAPYAGVSGAAPKNQSSELDGESSSGKKDDGRQTELLEEIQKSIAELKVQQQSTKRPSIGGERRCGKDMRDRHLLVRSYCRLGRFPVLGPVMQCLLILNICCAIILALPLSLRETLVYPVLTQVGLVIGAFFYPLLHVVERVSPQAHSFDLWFQGYLPVSVIAGLKQAFP